MAGTRKDNGPYIIVDNELPPTHPYGRGAGFFIYEATPELLQAAGIKEDEVDIEESRFRTAYKMRMAKERKEKWLRKDRREKVKQTEKEEKIDIDELIKIARTQGYWAARKELDLKRAELVTYNTRHSPPIEFDSWDKVPGYIEGVEEYKRVRELLKNKDSQKT